MSCWLRLQEGLVVSGSGVSMVGGRTKHQNDTGGPFVYENWKAALAGSPSRGVLEFCLFSEAPIISELKDLGPYQLLNALPLVSLPVADFAPAIVLRVEVHSGEPSEVKVPRKTNTERYHGGGLPSEFAGLLSLCFAARIEPGYLSRTFEPDGDPLGRPRAHHWHARPMLLRASSEAPVLPTLSERPSLAHAQRLGTIPMLAPAAAVALVRAAKLYQRGLWTSDAHPEYAWLMLVSAVETAAQYWRCEKEPPLDRMRASKPELAAFLQAECSPDVVVRVAELVADYMGATKTFVDFVLEFVPPPPRQRPPQALRLEWKAMPTHMRKVYHYRSRALHNGTPFPLPMCRPPRLIEGGWQEKPLGLAQVALGATWEQADTPMLLHVFEYLVRHALLRWWEAMTGDDV